MPLADWSSRGRPWRGRIRRASPMGSASASFAGRASASPRSGRGIRVSRPRGVTMAWCVIRKGGAARCLVAVMDGAPTFAAKTPTVPWSSTASDTRISVIRGPPRRPFAGPPSRALMDWSAGRSGVWHDARDRGAVLIRRVSGAPKPHMSGGRAPPRTNICCVSPGRRAPRLRPTRSFSSS